MFYGSFFCAIVSGILFILYSAAPDYIFTIIIALILSSLGIVLLNIVIIKYKKAGLYCLALACGLILGYSLHFHIRLRQEQYYKAYNEVTAFSGTIIKDSVYAGNNGYVHYAKINAIKAGYVQSTAAGKVIIFTSGGKRYYAGQIIKITGKLKKTEKNDKESHFFCFAANAAIEEQGFSSQIYEIRCYMLSTLGQRINGLGYPAAALFNALFLGNKDDLPEALAANFAGTGTLHILALSGLHVGIIYLFISVLLLPFPGKKLKILVGVPAVFFYLFLVGPMPSLQRAALMLLLLAASKLLYRETNSLNTLALSAFIILILDPLAAYALSFQLSFLALAGIILFGDKLTRLLFPWLPRFILIPLAGSIGAQLATMPVVLMNFGILYPSGIMVTLLLVPLVTVFMWAGIILLILGLFPVPVISYLGAGIMNVLYAVIAATAAFFARFPGIEMQWQDWYWILFLSGGVFVMNPFVRIKKLFKNTRLS